MHSRRSGRNHSREASGTVPLQKTLILPSRHWIEPGLGREAGSCVTGPTANSLHIFEKVQVRARLIIPVAVVLPANPARAFPPSAPQGLSLPRDP